MSLLELSVDIPPSHTEIKTAISNTETSFMRQVVKQALIQLKYRNVYLADELIDIFFYTRGMALVAETLIKHKVSPSCLPFARLPSHNWEYENSLNM